MKKALVAAVLGVMVAASSVSAMSFDTVTGFNGNLGGGPITKAYVPLTDDISAVVGFSANFSTSSKVASAVATDTTGGRGSDINSIVGINANLPLVGNVDVLTVWGQGPSDEGSVKTLAGGGAFMLTNIDLTKKFMAKITDKISIGLQVILLDIKMGNSTNQAQIGVMKTFYPVLGINVTL